jgi:hypothetical protein
MRAIISIFSSDLAPIEVMYLLEIVDELSLGHILFFIIDPDAEWDSLFNDGVNSVHRPLDIIILDGDLNLQHV